MLSALIHLPGNVKFWRLYTASGRVIDGPRFIADHDGGYSAMLGRVSP